MQSWSGDFDMKDKNMVKSALISMVVFGGLVMTGASHAQTVGINAAIKNKVQVRKTGASSLTLAKLKDRVRIGDYVSTGTNGVLQILLRDRTSFTVGKRGEVTIDRFVYDPANNASEVAASVTKGAFRFISGKPTRNRKGRSSVKTPVGSIGIRGTIFEGAVGQDAIAVARGEVIPANVLSDAGDEATLVVLRGPGLGTQGDEISGAIDLTTDQGVFPLDKAGEAYFVSSRNAEPIGPFLLSDAGLDILQDLLRSEPDRPQSASRPNPQVNPSIDRTLEVADGEDNPAGGQFDAPIP